MTTYIYKCFNCDDVKTIKCSIPEMEKLEAGRNQDIESEIYCKVCDCFMNRDFKAERVGTQIKGLGRASDGYASNIDDAEIYWHSQDPSSVGRHVEKETIPMSKADAQAEKRELHKKRKRTHTGHDFKNNS